MTLGAGVTGALAPLPGQVDVSDRNGGDDKQPNEGGERRQGEQVHSRPYGPPWRSMEATTTRLPSPARYCPPWRRPGAAVLPAWRGLPLLPCAALVAVDDDATNAPNATRCRPRLDPPGMVGEPTLKRR